MIPAGGALFRLLEKMLKLFVGTLLLSVLNAQILRFSIECNFDNTEILGNDRYTCTLSNLTNDFSSPFYFIQVTGDHLTGQTNNDVQNLRMIASRTNRIPVNIFNVFPNVEALEIDDCGNINFIPVDFFFANNLRDIRIVGNNISTLTNSAFTIAGSTLETLILENNNISTLGATQFAGGVNLQHVSVANNQIRLLTPRMTAPLRNLRVFDASDNLIEDIDGRIFFNSPLVEIVNFSGNSILSIGSSILNINSNIREFWLDGNVCATENFEFAEEVDLGEMQTALATCFRNSPWGTQLSLTVNGRLVIFDENDQVLLRIE